MVSPHEEAYHYARPVASGDTCEERPSWAERPGELYLHLDLTHHLQFIGQFVGAWDITITNIGADGVRQVVEGERHLGWALEGRALMDVGIAPRRSLRYAFPGDYGAVLPSTIPPSTLGIPPGSIRPRAPSSPAAPALGPPPVPILAAPCPPR